jgi:hypothetical protein
MQISPPYILVLSIAPPKKQRRPTGGSPPSPNREAIVLVFPELFKHELSRHEINRQTENRCTIPSSFKFEVLYL